MCAKCHSGGGKGVVVGKTASGFGMGGEGAWAWDATLRGKKKIPRVVEVKKYIEIAYKEAKR